MSCVLADNAPNVRSSTPGREDLVSLCVPTFNGAKYLRECLDSCLAQSHKNIEILIVDDCSSDTTVVIATEYAKKDCRIRVVCNEKNLGLVGNWNRCVELAKGVWIKFVFQDDLIAPACLERMVAAAQPDSSLVFCRRDFIFEEGTTQSARDAYLGGQSLVERLFPDSTPVSARRFSEIVLNNMERNLIGEPTAVMLHRRVFPQFGGFNPHLIVSCDTQYWIRVGIHTGVVPVPEVLASFRVHGDSVSAQSLAKREYRMNVLDELAVLHDVVFNPAYQPLRKAAAESGVDLVRQFWDKALWAYGIAKRAERDEAYPDNALMREWREVAAHFKRLSSIPLRYSMQRQGNLIKHQFRSLLGLKRSDH